MDANGDVTVAYQGFGPDVNDSFTTTAQSQTALDNLLSPTGPNADLVTQWDNNNAIKDQPLENLSLPLPTGFLAANPPESAAPGAVFDIDNVINEILASARQTTSSAPFSSAVSTAS